MRSRIASLLCVTSLLLSMMPASAHHSVLHYDGKREVVISGVITAGRFAFPHSVYSLDVRADDGSMQEWTLMTEDPKDAEKLGFAEALRELKPGDEITVIGWPHRFNEHEIRGHQLHYPDGRVVFMRRGNYIWPKDILRLDGFVSKPETLTGVLEPVAPDLSFAAQVVAWAAENDPAARAAFEVVNKRARLIGLLRDGTAVFSGVHELLVCHTEKPDFTVVIDVAGEDPAMQAALQGSLTYIAEYNRLLSRWWEQEKESC